MKVGWVRQTLGECCDLIGRGIAPKYVDEGGVRVINQKCIRDHQIDFTLARRHDAAIKRVSPERIIRVGDVLVNSTGTGTLGRVAQIRTTPDEPTTVDTHVTIVRPRAGLFHPEFFGHAMISIEDALMAGGVGASGQTELPRTDLETKYSVCYPTSHDEQKRIVAVLDEAFEGLSRAHANAEANLADAQELFGQLRSSFFSQPSPTWATHMLSEVCEKITDGTHQTPKYFESGHVFLSSRNVTSGRIDWENVKFIDDSQHVEMQRRVSPRRGDVLLAKNGTTGVGAIVDRDISFDIYVSLALLRAKAGLLPELLLHFINSAAAKQQFNGRLKGSGVPNLHLKEIREVTISYPKDENEQRDIVARIEEVLEAKTEMEAALQTKLRLIDTLRQSLLQKAFSGELT